MTQVLIFLSVTNLGFIILILIFQRIMQRNIENLWEKYYDIKHSYLTQGYLQEWRKIFAVKFDRIEQKINQLECDHPEDDIAYKQNSYTLTKSCNKCNKILKLYYFPDELDEYKKDKAAHELKRAQKNHDEAFEKKDKKCTK